MTALKVFISYSQDSPEHISHVLHFANRLVSEGIDVIFDQYEMAPPEGWPHWMEKNIRVADFVLMVCTGTYFRRVVGEEEEGIGKGVKWEGNLIIQHIYSSETKNSKFIPVLLNYSHIEDIPTPVKGASYYWIETAEGYNDLYRRITGQPRIKKPELGSKVIMEAVEPIGLINVVTKSEVEKIVELIKFGEFEKAIKECDRRLERKYDDSLLNILFVVASLRGKGADRYQTSTITKLEKHLSKACEEKRYRATGLAIWGIIKHDHYKLNSFWQDNPTFAEIKDLLAQVDLKTIDFDIVVQVKASKSVIELLNFTHFFQE